MGYMFFKFSDQIFLAHLDAGIFGLPTIKKIVIGRGYFQYK